MNLSGYATTAWAVLVPSQGTHPRAVSLSGSSFPVRVRGRWQPNRRSARWPADSAAEGTMLDWSLVHLVDVHEVTPSMAGVSCGMFNLPGRGLSLTKWLVRLPVAKAVPDG